jgi:hypothetical protein
MRAHGDEYKHGMLRIYMRLLGRTVAGISADSRLLT